MRPLSLPVLLALVLPSSAAGCFPIPEPLVAPSAPVCLVEKKSGTPWTAPDFIASGDAMRDEALVQENARLLAPPMVTVTGEWVMVWTSALRDARDCYERALRVYPSSYEATLGLGTVYLIAGLRSGPGTMATGSFYAAARRHLGRAYFMRNDQQDPLLYLALVAALEGQFGPANEILGHLQRAQLRSGEVLTLSGYVAERSGDVPLARRFYQSAFYNGASAETLQFLTNRLSAK